VISCAPTVELRIDGVDFSDLVSITGGPKAFTIALGTPDVPVILTGLDELPLARLSLLSRTNADPVIDYAIAFQNFLDTPLFFDYSVTQPFVGGPYTALFTSHSGSVTESGSPNATVVVQAPAEGFVHQPFVNSTNVDGLNPGCMVATGVGGSGNCPQSPPFSTSVPIATGETGTFGVEVSFTLSPGDIYTLNGRVELLPTQVPGQVPEPATLLLLAGAGTLAYALRRRSGRL
jgi:hypothetical protein